MRYGLVGEQLEYSYSKLVHEKLGCYEYELLSLPQKEFETFIVNRQYSGLNITIPYKKQVLAYCDYVSPIAKSIGAVNTLYFDQGNLCGTNTDYDGFLYMLRRAKISLRNKTVLILGTGGTSLTLQKAASDEGAKRIMVASRNSDSSEMAISYNELPNHPDIEIVINATPVGTYPNNGEKLLSLDCFPACCGVLDVIYNPFHTDLLLQAKRKGIPHSGGLPMLVAQATAAAALFTQTNDFQDKNDDIIKDLKSTMRNVVLIGMPGSGKSTVGKMLAKELGKSFIDTDESIVQKFDMSIPKIFEKFGEAVFRDAETEMSKIFGKERSLVIATGGGIVLRPENMDALMQNAAVIFLDRPLSALETEGRPLSTDIAALASMYEKRFPLYNKYKDYIIKANGEVPEIVHQITQLLGGI